MSQFDTETHMTAQGGGVYTGHVHPQWSIGANPNGGYLLSLAVAALRQAVPQHPDPLSITVHYLRPGLPGQACEARTQVVRSGRTLSTCRVTLVQDGSERLEVLAAMGDLGEGGEARLSIEAPPMPPPADCVPRSGHSQGVHLPLLDRLDILLHPEESDPAGARRAQVTGWIRFKDGRQPDTAAALLFTDTFPPSVFGLLGMVGWVPTVELTVHIRRRPSAGWMLGQFRTHDLNDGRMIEDGLLWDASGQLIAQARQLALVRQPG